MVGASRRGSPDGRGFRWDQERLSKNLGHYSPCPTCSLVTAFAEEKGIELDKRDVEQQAPYDELCALGGDANKIPYIHHDGQLVQGVEACNALLAAL